MSKKEKRFPEMRKDRTYAYVRLNGEKIMLGKWDSPDAQRAYNELHAKWLLNPSLASAPSMPDSTTVDSLALAFLDWIKTYDPTHYGSFRTAISTLLSRHSGQTVDKLDSPALLIVQNDFVLQGHSRTHCNTLVNYIRSMLKWGVPLKLVPYSVYEESKLVPPLRENRTTAKENDERLPVPDAIVEQTLPFLLPTVAAMVRIQRLTGMRPGELVRMSVGEIDRTGDVWIYEPSKHKNSHRKQRRPVPLCKQAQEIIASRLVGKAPDDSVFSPKDAVRERRERDARRRKSKTTPSQRRRSEKVKKNPKRSPKDFYTPQSYGQSIEYAIEAANNQLTADQQIEHWVPYQIRHLVGTEIVQETQNEFIAKAILGHKDIRSTRRYVHADTVVATDYVRQKDTQKEK